MLTCLISILVGMYVIVNNYQAICKTYQYELQTYCYFVVVQNETLYRGGSLFQHAFEVVVPLALLWP